MVFPSSSLEAERIKFVPINLRDSVQYEEFKHHRVLCGWDSADACLQKFMDKQEKKLKSLFWIMIRPETQADDGKDSANGKIHSSNASNGVVTRHTTDSDDQHATAEAANNSVTQPPGSLFIVRAGHISLDSYAEPPDAELAREDRSIMTISTFFILPEHRTGGLGRAAMNLIEALATREPYGSPHCHTLALTTLSRRYFHEDGPEGRGVWKLFGMDPPPFSNVDWYQKLGYVAWKEETRYLQQTLQGNYVDLFACFMRKKLRD